MSKLINKISIERYQFGSINSKNGSMQQNPMFEYTVNRDEQDGRVVIHFNTSHADEDTIDLLEKICATYRELTK